MCQSIQVLIILVAVAKAPLAGGDQLSQNDKSVHKAILLKPDFHSCLKGAWDMSEVPVTHVSTCVLSQAQ